MQLELFWPTCLSAIVVILTSMGFATFLSWIYLNRRKYAESIWGNSEAKIGKQVAQVSAFSLPKKVGLAQKANALCPMRSTEDEQSLDEEINLPLEDIDKLNETLASPTGKRLEQLSKQLKSEPIELGKLHGKLMTADLRNKFKEYERRMSNSQRRDEEEIRVKQLDTIFQLMQNQQDKFGQATQSDIVEQMKLYNI